MLRSQPKTRRPDEGATGGDDRAEPSGHKGLVSKQEMQGQEEEHHDEATSTTTATTWTKRRECEL